MTLRDAASSVNTILQLLRGPHDGRPLALAAAHPPAEAPLDIDLSDGGALRPVPQPVLLMPDIPLDPLPEASADLSADLLFPRSGIDAPGWRTQPGVHFVKPC